MRRYDGNSTIRKPCFGRCRDCKETIAWMKTYKGRNIPVNINTISDEEKEALQRGNDLMFDPMTHACHFDTCLERDRDFDKET